MSFTDFDNYYLFYKNWILILILFWIESDSFYL